MPDRHLNFAWACDATCVPYVTVKGSVPEVVLALFSLFTLALFMLEIAAHAIHVQVIFHFTCHPAFAIYFWHDEVAHQDKHIQNGGQLEVADRNLTSILG